MKYSFPKTQKSIKKKRTRNKDSFKKLVKKSVVSLYHHI